MRWGSRLLAVSRTNDDEHEDDGEDSNHPHDSDEGKPAPPFCAGALLRRLGRGRVIALTVGGDDELVLGPIVNTSDADRREPECIGLLRRRLYDSINGIGAFRYGDWFAVEGGRSVSFNADVKDGKRGDFSGVEIGFAIHVIRSCRPSIRRCAYLPSVGGHGVLSQHKTVLPHHKTELSIWLTMMAEVRTMTVVEKRLGDRRRGV